MPDRGTTKWLRVRTLVVCGVLGLAALVVGWRVWVLQVRQGPWLRDLSRQQVLKQIVLEPLRGPILDRHGAPLAVSIMAHSIFAQPRQLAHPRADALALARALEMNRAQTERLVKRLTKRRIFTWVKRRVSDRLAERVRRLGLAGVGFTRESRRYYPSRELAANLLGFVSDGRGLEGVELMFDDRLRGSTVILQGLRDAHGQLVFPEGMREPDAGGTVVLTIDANIQEIVERELAQGLAAAQARAALAVVMDPHSGEVLALANLPSYNPNNYSRSSPASRRNRAVTDCFEPGSTMKVFTMAWALESGVVSADEIIDCRGGVLNIGRHTIHDSHRGLKRISATEVLVHSSNVGMAQIGNRLGRQSLYQGLRAFGFGRKTGIDLPGEMRCRLRRPETWSDVGLATISFGQGVSVNALQLLSALNAVANGGVWLRPQIIREIRDSAGRVLERAQPDPRGRVISAEVSEQLRRIMIKVVEPGGTGRAAAVPGFQVAGKTGTAQKVDPLTGGYSEHLRVASFMGFLPAERPRLSILVVIDEPQTSPYGGVVAAPVFARIAAATLKYLGVYAPAPALAAAAAAPAHSAVAATGAETPIVAAEDNPDRAAAPVVPAGQSVPQVVGLSARAAVARLWRAGYQVRLQGVGRVIEQQPRAGSPRPHPPLITLHLSPAPRSRNRAGGNG